MGRPKSGRVLPSDRPPADFLFPQNSRFITRPKNAPRPGGFLQELKRELGPELQLNIFDCRHKRMTRPITPVNKTNSPEAATYVVCLECGRQFVYDLKTMRVGPRIPASPASGVLDSDSPGRKNALRYAVIASVAPLVWAASHFLRKAKRPSTREKH
jgi:hypothetical protein